MSQVLYAASYERHRRVVQLTQRGHTAPSIATVLGCTIRTVQRHRHSAGLTSGHHAAPFSTEERERALALLNDGASYAEVGRTLGRRYQQIAKTFPGYGWTQEQTVVYREALRAFNAIGTTPLGVFR